MRRLCGIGALLFLGLLLGCTREAHEIDLAKEKQALLAIYEAGKQAHLDTSVEALLADHGDTFLSVSGGQIVENTRADVATFFGHYFKDATYYTYEDLEPPIVQVSADGSLGWIIARIQAHRGQADENGTMREQQFVYAGIMLYEKRDGKWIRTGNVSTFEE